MDQERADERIFHRALKERWPVISHGEGLYLVDTEGRRYLDACAGVHVVSIGHGVEEIAQAMHRQASQVTFTYSRFVTQAQIDLADHIAGRTPGDLNRVFFVSGGSEATESALKMARKYHLSTGNPQKYQVISRWQSWHGNTVGAMSMSGRSLWRQDYEPYLLQFPHILPPYCYRCPDDTRPHHCGLNGAEELERIIHQVGAQHIAAFIAEPVLGTSACGAVPPPEYFPDIRDLCDRHNILLIVDEVVTGFGRTGLDFGIQHWDVVPDILATGKGLSSGYAPLAATVTTEKVYQGIYRDATSFSHGHTYGGNPLSCAVGLAVQQYAEEHDLVEQCRRMGDLLLERLETLAKESPIVGQVRGRGLLNGIDLVADKDGPKWFDPARGVTARAVELAFERGVLIMPGAPGLVDGVNGDHLAISPPFTISSAEVDKVVEVLRDSLGVLATELGY